MKKARLISLADTAERNNNENRIRQRTQKLRACRQRSLESLRKFKSKILTALALDHQNPEQIYSALNSVDLADSTDEQQVLLTHDLIELLKTSQPKKLISLRFIKNSDQNIAEFIATHYKLLCIDQVEDWVGVMDQNNRKKFYRDIKQSLGFSCCYLTDRVIKTILIDIEQQIQAANLTLEMLKQNQSVQKLISFDLIPRVRELIITNIQRPFTYYNILAMIYFNRPNETYSCDLLRVLFGKVHQVIEAPLYDFTVLLMGLVMTFPVIVKTEEIVRAVRVIERQLVPKLIHRGLLYELKEAFKCMYAIHEASKRYSVEYKPKLYPQTVSELSPESRHTLQPLLNYLLQLQ